MRVPTACCGPGARNILRPMYWLGRGLLTAGMVWFLIASFVGGARSLTLSTAMFVLGIVVTAMA